MNVYIYIHTSFLVTYTFFIPVFFVMRPDTCYRLRGPIFNFFGLLVLSIFFIFFIFLFYHLLFPVSKASHSQYEQGRRCMHVGAFSGGVLDSSCI